MNDSARLGSTGNSDGAQQDTASANGSRASTAAPGPQASDAESASSPSADADAAPELGPGKEISKPPKLGELDPNGCPVVEIFASTRQFAIYQSDNQVRYMLPDDYEVARGLRNKVAGLGGLRASIEDLRADKSIAATESTRAARELSWALALAFEDDRKPPSETPKEILTRVDTRLRSLIKSHLRREYVLWNLSAFTGIEVLLIAFFVVAWQWGSDENVSALHRYALYGAFGGVGALLSVVTGMRSIDIDVNLKAWEHAFAGATRILIGVVAAFVVALALDSHLVDPTFGNARPGDQAAVTKLPGSLDRQLALRCLLAFVAGFSESLVPNLLRRAEQATAGSDRPNSTTAAIKDVKA